MTGKQPRLFPPELEDLHVSGVITSGGRPIKIHVRGKAKQHYKRHTTGRKAPYGTQTRHHHIVLECPHCYHLIVSLYRVRHTYKSLHNWLVKAFNIKRHFRFPSPKAEHLDWSRIENRKCATSVAKAWR